MCLIILNIKNMLPKETLWESWLNNSDSFGLAYIIGSKLHVNKYVTDDPTQAFDDYEQIRTQTNFPILLHFRIATHGAIDVENCHPFYVNPNLVFAHNGVIATTPEYPNESDTVAFNRQILKRIPHNVLLTPPIIKLIERYVSGSRLVFLDNSGNYHILNERYGLWDNGDWYSNRSYQCINNNNPFYWDDNPLYYDLFKNNNKRGEYKVCLLK